MVRRLAAVVHLSLLICLFTWGCGPDFSKCDTTSERALMVWSGDSVAGEPLKDGGMLQLNFFAQGGMGVTLTSALAGVDGFTDVNNLVVTLEFDGETIGAHESPNVEKIDCTADGLLELDNIDLSVNYYDIDYMLINSGTLSVSVNDGEMITKEISVTFGY
jgi:hypothetical protein